MPTEAHKPEAWGEDDRLAQPGVDTATILKLGAGFLVFVAVALTLLMLFYRHEVGPDLVPTAKPFPDPRLETNINPRSMPDTGRGPTAIPRPLPVATPNSRNDLDQAMAIVAARGAAAYDSPGPPPPARTVETLSTTTIKHGGKS